MTLAWIGLGANLGDAAVTVGAAISALDRQPHNPHPQTTKL
jgi:2-amino-4-hydroxy-6-hydroxymethyldihydropteridine diphosphokinase